MEHTHTCWNCHKIHSCSAGLVEEPVPGWDTEEGILDFVQSNKPIPEYKEIPCSMVPELLCLDCGAAGVEPPGISLFSELKSLSKVKQFC